MKRVSPALTPGSPQTIEVKLLQALAQPVPLFWPPTTALSTYQLAPRHSNPDAKTKAIARRNVGKTAAHGAARKERTGLWSGDWTARFVMLMARDVARMLRL